MILWPEIPCIPTTLLVVARPDDAAEAAVEYPHWAVCAAMDVLSGARFDRIYLAGDINLSLHPDFYRWFRTCLRGRLKPGGTIKKMSPVDTYSDMC